MANTHSRNNVRASSNFAAINNSLGITGGNVTIEAWVRCASQPATNANWGIVHQASTTNLNEYALRYVDVSGTKKLMITRTKSGVADNSATFNTTLTTGTWYHLAITYDGTNVRLYTAIEGGTHTQQAIVASSGAGSGFTNPNFFAVGTYVRENASGDSYATCIAQTDTTTNNPFDGLIDDVRVWSTARAAATMDADFQQELTGSETNLVAYYKFNNNVNDTTASAFNFTDGSGTFSTTVPIFTGGATGNSNFLSFF